MENNNILFSRLFEPSSIISFPNFRIYKALHRILLEMKKNKPGAGRPRLYNEPTMHIQVPRSLVELVKAFIREHSGRN